MKIIRERPPNFDAIAAVFDVRGKPVLFAYLDTIYVPSGGNVPPLLVEHERAHGERQKVMGVEAWWERYLTDASFREAEEVIGHRAEYQALCRQLPSRSDRRRHLSHVAARLSSSMYRYSITKDQARKVLEDGNS